jgi:hypothetical protein
MARKRKAKTKAKKKVAKSKKRAAPTRKKKAASNRRTAKKSAKPKRRVAKTTLPPRGKTPSASRSMTQPGAAVTPIVPRLTSFPSSLPGDAPTSSPDGKN